MHWLDESLDRLRETHRLRTPLALDYLDATHATLDHRTVLVFCSNDYLGLRFDPALKRAAEAAIRTEGTGAGASRLVAGTISAHVAAEQALSEWLGTETALLTSSGYATNVAVPSSLADSADDVLFSDALNHASLIDGCRLARARTVVYPHCDLDELKRRVAAARPFRRGFVLTESLFGMDSDLAPLEALRALCDAEGLGLYVDEAHALGVLGPDGAGALADAAVTADVLVGTLGKSLGSGGAFVAGSHSLRLYLWNRCRSFVFSTALPPASAAVAGAAVALVRTEPAIRTRLYANVVRFRTTLGRAGLDVPGDPRSPIVPVIVGRDEDALRLSAALLADGFFVPCIRPPTVPPGTARLRVTLSAAHTAAELDALAERLVHHLGTV